MVTSFDASARRRNLSNTSAWTGGACVGTETGNAALGALQVLGYCDDMATLFRDVLQA